MLTSAPPAADVLAAHVRQARTGTVEDALHAIAAAQAPPPCEAPDWLHARHHALLGRTVHALQVRSGVLVQAPTGYGKSWLALAAAQVRNDRLALCAPAITLPQWRRLAASLDLPLYAVSHESASRRPPDFGASTLVVIDEAHRFRTPSTQRYGSLRGALQGRTALLLAATPVVNRLEDLAHQLALALPDDVLARDGVPSVRALLRAGGLHPALGRILLHPESPTVRPAVQRDPITPALDAERAAALHGISALGLSTDPVLAALLRHGLLRALASSCAAAAAALGRYARLLAHAADAHAAGRPLARRDLLRQTQDLDDQLVLWSLLPTADAPADLRLDDAPTVAALQRAMQAAPDDGLQTIAARLDATPTVLFTGWRATAHALVQRLGPRTAWVIGETAGIGPARLPREAVLSHFRGPPTHPRAPHLLVATDVAAEGLDLVRLRRVVHVDLPWTPMRLAQREGRARRGGSAAATIEVQTVQPPQAIDAQLRQLARLAGKAALLRHCASTLRDLPWRVPIPIGRSEVPPCPPGPIIAAVRRAGPPALLCALLDEHRDLHLVLHEAGTPVEQRADRLRAVLDAAAVGPSCAVPPWAGSGLIDLLRHQLAHRRVGDWLLRPPDAPTRLLGVRLRALAVAAVHQRDAAAVALAERALRAAPSLGPEDRHALADLADGPLRARLQSLDAAGRLEVPRPPIPAVRLVAALCFVPDDPAATLAPWPPTVPSSSISTAR